MKNTISNIMLLCAVFWIITKLYGQYLPHAQNIHKLNKDNLGCPLSLIKNNIGEYDVILNTTSRIIKPFKNMNNMISGHMWR